jgi:hypothetical protein
VSVGETLRTDFRNYQSEKSSWGFDMDENSPVFATLVTDLQDLHKVNILINSLRHFGGALINAPFFVFLSSNLKRMPIQDTAKNIRQFRLKEKKGKSGYYFASKICAWAKAEKISAQLTHSLIWIDPACLIIHTPDLLLLDKNSSAAFRPVHIRNIGQLINEKLDGFWSAVYKQCKTPHPLSGIDSFVDEQAILPYFNSHCFSIDPQLGILAVTKNNLETLAVNENFMKSFCADEAHKIFLFQAVLTSTLLSQVPMNAIRILPPDYGYPFHLQEKIPEHKRINQLNDLTVMVYEDEDYLHKAFTELSPATELRSWHSSIIHQQ